MKNVKPEKKRSVKTAQTLKDEQMKKKNARRARKQNAKPGKSLKPNSKPLDLLARNSKLVSRQRAPQKKSPTKKPARKPSKSSAKKQSFALKAMRNAAHENSKNGKLATKRKLNLQLNVKQEKMPKHD